ncbi:hypothetical protein ACJIZ3_020519 [Penstemon smallii]|uniref:Uncharacterized protein n=1 Tax=Penstemon smallii TaxID=265156 RepID=A0ABD3SJ45_9LAMI
MAHNSADESVKEKAKKDLNRGAWTAEEDRKLAEAINTHGSKQWTIIAKKAGLKRCTKSCRLRWMNYLRPNIKRGNISDQEEDLIIRLHKLLGNRWSLIAARLPGRTDNEIKNYWNSHLSKKKFKQGTVIEGISIKEMGSKCDHETVEEENTQSSSSGGEDTTKSSFDVDDFFDFSNEKPSTLEWVTKFIEFSDA